MMILRLKAQLGNQMFQYAALRTYADRNNLRLLIINRHNHLFHAFGIGRPKWMELMKCVALPAVLRAAGYRDFEPPRQTIAQDLCTETSVESFPDNRIVSGWLQDPSYFQGNEAAVREWFSPRPAFGSLAEKFVESTGVPRDHLCAIHVRLGDYYTSDSGRGHPVLGWVLPPEYFRAAIESLPKGLTYIILSDMPDRAASWLGYLDRKIVSKGNPAVVDQQIMRSCKFNIISNSTFSWWGAWLNSTSEKVVVAPEFFNGWWRGLWEPPNIKMPDWRYIPRERVVRGVAAWASA